MPSIEWMNRPSGVSSAPITKASSGGLLTVRATTRPPRCLLRTEFRCCAMISARVSWLYSGFSRAKSCVSRTTEISPLENKL